MHVTTEAFWLPKSGNAPEDYEDAFWPMETPKRHQLPLRVAIADGATEASFSRLWASILVEAYATGGIDVGSVLDGLPQLQKQWLSETSGMALPWYAEAKLEAGAFAAVLGLTIQQPNRSKTGKWTAVAIGDCCLFHVRGDSLLQRFPLESSSQFSNRPTLVSSVEANNHGLLESRVETNGTWKPGDTFYLMSDALACWFLRRWELLGKNDDPQHFLDYVAAVTDQGAFEGLVRTEHSDMTPEGTPMLRNDDQTMMRCTITAA